MGKKLTDFQQLLEIIGVEHGYAISETFGGNLLYIPKNKIDIEKRNDIIRKEFYSGKEQIELAKKYKLSRRQIIRILKAGRTRKHEK